MRRPATPPSSPKSPSSQSEKKVTFNDEKKIIPRDGGAEGGGHGEKQAVAEEKNKKMSRWKKWRQKRKAQVEHQPKSPPQDRDSLSTRVPALKQKEKSRSPTPLPGNRRVTVQK